MEDKQPMKLTITHADGHTESYDIFIAVVAKGLLPAGKSDDGRVYYMADEEHFTITGACSIAADTAVVAGLLEGIFSVVSSILETAKDDPSALHELLRSLSLLGLEKTVLFGDKKIIHKRPEEN